MSGIEEIRTRGTTLAYIVRREVSPDQTTFVTPEVLPFQIGFVVYGEGKEVPRHVHLPLERHISVTSEVVLVRSGRCQIDLFDESRDLVATRELREGDIVLLLSGGHGFRMDEDTVLFEVKQGPFTGLEEKQRF